jgi:hypothetical protein
MVERELQLFEGKRSRATIEGDIGITMDSPHVLFDVPLEETLREFIELLDGYYDPNLVYERLRDPDDIPDRNPMFVFEQALSEVLDLPDHEGFASLASDNTAAAAHEVESWEALAAVWLWQYLSAYNRHLHEREPEALEDLETAVADLEESELVAADDVPALARHFAARDG